MKSKETQYIYIKGARVHNLKDIDLAIPKNKLVVITGLSGSGKSSLAFDTIYAEAERRFVESLSSYARQFLGVKEKPDAESIEGLSPAISIDQKSISKNPRSTVGTITEIYDYLRILFARIGKPHCPQCGKPVGRQTADQIVNAIAGLPKKDEVILLAPLVRGKKGEHRDILEEVSRAGFFRVRINGDFFQLEDAIEKSKTSLLLDKKKKHSIEVVVDRFSLADAIERSRIRDSVETALRAGKGVVIVNIRASNHSVPAGSLQGKKEAGAEDLLFSERFACDSCGISMSDIEPRTFSFNSPYGACPACTGIGSTLEVDAGLVIPNKRLTIGEGAIRPWASTSHRVGRQGWYWWILSDIAERHGFSLNTPVEKLPQEVLDIILYGETMVRGSTSQHADGTFEGVIPNLKRRWKETDSEFTRAEIEKYMIIRTCGECKGDRLKKEALAVRIGSRTIASIVQESVASLLPFFKKNSAGKEMKERDGGWVHTKEEMKIAEPIFKEIIKRLEFLVDVGLEYLTLSRESTTLAGGEAQRIQLATQIGSRLTGVIYILDEPSIGLHPRDHARLITTLKSLRDLGNTVIVVEHDAETMKNADWIIDLGPGAGKHGGRVVFSGTPKELFRAHTLTGEYLSGKRKISIQSKNPTQSEIQNYLTLRRASEHNLKNIDVVIPLERFVCVSGVSGSGKSTLINDILAKALLAKLYNAHLIPGAHKEITGTEHINKVVVVDQSPIGRTPRSNPSTYTGVFGLIRSIFAQMPEARARGYSPGRFSFNVKGGRCEICEGQGVKKIEMYFLPDVYVECEECRGKRYNKEALEIEYRGKNVSEILDMPVEEALGFFEAMPAIRAKLSTLQDVGLEYVKLGQPSTTLSGGEAQRIKLATELSRKDTGRTLYILDEPTTGLHFEDIQKLLSVLSALVEKKNTVLVIEHNLDVLRNADWIIDLGPEGGEGGGRIIAEGPPEKIMRVSKSHTGQWLKKLP